LTQIVRREVPYTEEVTQLVERPYTEIEEREIEEDVLRTRLVPRTVMVEEEYVDTEVSYVEVPRTRYEMVEETHEVERSQLVEEVVPVRHRRPLLLLFGW